MDLLDQVRMEQLDDDQRALAELVGMEAFKTLVRTYSGTSLYVPKIEAVEKAARDERIREEFDGRNYRELARKYGLTEMWIRTIVLDKAREMKARPVDGQMSFEDFLGPP